MPLSDDQLASYGFELRDDLDAALFRLTRLEAVATKWVALNEQWKPGPPAKIVGEMLGLHAEAFDHIDGVLAAFSRVSFLLHPSPDKGFAAKRAKNIRACLGIAKGSMLNDRGLRDSWIHHDARLDAAVAANAGRGGQKFTISKEVTAATKKAFLRIVEFDTLCVHYRDAHGDTKKVSLRKLGKALEQVPYKKLLVD